MLVGRESARVDVDVRIDLDGGDGDAEALEDGPQRAGDDSFADAGDDSARDEDVFHGGSGCHGGGERHEGGSRRAHVCVAAGPLPDPCQNARPSPTHFPRRHHLASFHQCSSSRLFIFELGKVP